MNGVIDPETVRAVIHSNSVESGELKITSKYYTHYHKTLIMPEAKNDYKKNFQGGKKILYRNSRAYSTENRVPSS